MGAHVHYRRHAHDHGADKWLLVIIVCLVLTGAFMVYSTTSVVTPTGIDRDDGGASQLVEFYYLKRHMISLLIGFFLMGVFYKVRLEVIRRNAFVLFTISILLLLLVFLPGVGITRNGAMRWIAFGPVRFQPSELLKLTMIIFLAKYLSSRYFRADRLSSFIVPVILMAMVQAFLIMQPDFGGAFIIGVLTLSLLFIAKVRLRYLMSLVFVLIPFVIKLILEPYRLKRVLAFLDPWADPRGSGFQLVQSFIAFGSGGITGVGMGKSSQKLFFLPEAKTDFIFSIIGEELGFIGVIVVMLLFILFFMRGMMITRKLKNGFLFYLAAGITLVIMFQALINMAVVTGLLPTKGLTLPFISYGGSSLVVSIASAGLLLSISKVEGVGEEVTVCEKRLMKRERAKGDRVFKRIVKGER